MTWKFQQIEPQPARGTLREEMWESPDWIAEEKYDGDRRIAQFCGHIVRFTGRRKSVKDGLFVEKSANVPHLSARPSVWKIHGVKDKDIPDAHTWPPSLQGTVLDGEMIATESPFFREVKGGLSKYVTSIMGSLPEEAIRKQIERGWLRYVVFDCLFYKGRDVRGMRLLDRNEFMCEAVEQWKNPFALVAPNEINRNKRSYCENIIARGGEGIILKSRDHRYGDKNLWVKVKKQSTADVVIMGFKSAKEMSTKKGDDKATMTKFAKQGLIGAIQCGQYPRAWKKNSSAKYLHLTEVATVSGFPDDLRREMTLKPKKFIGRVIEIEHNGREPTGRFRHPRFNRFRDDKRAIECVYREDES